MIQRQWWSCPPLWAGETAFLLAGGPSLRGFAAEQLRGRRVLALKESCLIAPFAPMMFFADNSWFLRERGLIDGFGGEVVTVAKNAADTRCRLMRRGDKEGLAAAPDTLNGADTSAAFAIDLLAHLGVARIGLLGMDLGHDPFGPARHHTRNPVKPRAESFDLMAATLATKAASLAARGIAVFNCTPGGRLDIWPRVNLTELLAA